MTTNIKTGGDPDYDGVIDYVLQRLSNELPDNLTYHRAWHTEFDVLPAAQRLAIESGLPLSEQRLLEVGAAFHDIGFIYNPIDHEDIGVQIAKEIMPKYGFKDIDIHRVEGLVLATRQPQSPQNHLEELLVDADLDSLGREDYQETSLALWQELKVFGKAPSWECWLYFQLLFLKKHNYFTAQARQLRDAGKKENIANLEQIIHDEVDEPDKLAEKCAPLDYNNSP